MELRLVGFWRPSIDDDSSGLPHPRDAVDATWPPRERERVVRYLRKGRVTMAYMGYSRCRFECGIGWSHMGSCDLSDGRWVWPQGYAHYVDHHAVKPPAEFLDDIARRLPRLPPWWRLVAALRAVVQRRRVRTGRRRAELEAGLAPVTTALHEAADAGDVAAIERALAGQRIEDKNRSGETALHRASRAGKPIAVRALLARGADPNATDGSDGTPLANAATRDVVAALIEAGAAIDPPTAASSTPLTRAAMNGDVDQVRLLIDRGAAIDRADRFRTPLEAATSRAVVELLLERGADPKLGRVLIDVIRRGELDLVERLLDLGADVNARDSRSQTPAFYAAEAPAGDPILALLIARGADVDRANDLGDTALHMACKRCSLVAVELLLAAGASVRTKSRRKMRPLHWATHGRERGEDSAALIERLLAAGAGPIDARNEWGQTALWLAVDRGDVAAARALVAAGARVDVKDDDKLSPRMIAERAGDRELLAVIGHRS